MNDNYDDDNNSNNGIIKKGERMCVRAIASACVRFVKISTSKKKCRAVIFITLWFYLLVRACVCFCAFPRGRMCGFFFFLDIN